MKKIYLTLFILATILAFSAIVALGPGWGRSTLLFVGVVSGITGMGFLVADLMKK